MGRGRRDRRQGWILRRVGLGGRLADEAGRGRLRRGGGEGEVGGGVGGRRGAEGGVYVHGVVVGVRVRVGVGLGVRDGQRQLGAARRPARVVQSVRGSGGDGGVRGQRRGRAEAGHHVVARVLGGARRQPLQRLGVGGDAALPLGCGEAVRQGVVLRHALHMITVMVVVGRGRGLLGRVSTDSASSTVDVAVLGVQSLELGRPPSHTSAPANSARVGRTEVGRRGGAWGRGGGEGDGRRGGGVVGG